MNSVLFLLITLYLFASVYATENTLKKITRQSASKFSLLPKSSQTTSEKGKFQIKQSTSSTSMKGKQYSNQISQTSVPFNNNALNKVKNIAIGIKDEVVDCFDSLVYAETNTERLDNLFDIAYRHRPIVAAGALIVVGKIALSQSQAVSAAERMKRELTVSEAAKWGKRLR